MNSLIRMTNSDKIEINLAPVQRTLFLPVIARAQESKKAKPILVDLAAIEIAERVNFDFKNLSSSASELSRIALIARCTCFDRLIKDFIRRYPTGTIVDIGCGLNTTYDRVNNGLIKWYDLDLPDVIELRKLFMKETMNRKFIVGSFLENTWYKYLNCPERILFIAGGVFYYYEERIIRAFLIKVSKMFPACEMLFDVTSPAGVRATNKALRKSGMDERFLLKWGLKNTDTILSWTPQLRLLGKYPTFTPKGISGSLKSWLPGWISDSLNIHYTLHFKIRFDYKHIK
jgi:O-methyltransferase involved in polyketide biosynthesis